MKTSNRGGFQRWGSYFLKVTHYLLLLSITKSNLLQLHSYYPRNKVTIIILATYYITFRKQLKVCDVFVPIPTMCHYHGY